jgi:hypothetical protein
VHNKLFRKGLVIGVILLFLCLVYTPIINAETNTNSYKIKSMRSSVNNSSNDNWPPSFFSFGFQRIKGKITGFKIYDDLYRYYLNVTKVNITTLMVSFNGIPFLNFGNKVYEKDNYNFPEFYIKNYKFIKEKVTDEYIDCLIFIWGYFTSV